MSVWDTWIEDYNQGDSADIQTKDEQLIYTAVRNGSFFADARQIDYPYIIEVLLIKNRGDIIEHIRRICNDKQKAELKNVINQAWNDWIADYIHNRTDIGEDKIYTAVRNGSFFADARQIDYPYIIEVLLIKNRGDIIEQIRSICNDKQKAELQNVLNNMSSFSRQLLTT
jgi:hypothetical protein